MMTATRWLAPGLLAAMLLAPSVWAQAPSAQARSAARALAAQGDELWNQTSYAEAFDRFTRAFDLVGAPTLGIRQGECLEKLGRLVEAYEKYQQISRAKLDAGAPDAFRQAVETARQRVHQLRPRLPMLTVVVEGDDLEGARLTLDGKEVPEAMWGAEWPADPGTRQVELTKGDRRASGQVTLEEGKPHQLRLVLPPGDATESPTPEPAPTTAPLAQPSPPPEPPPGAPAPAPAPAPAHAEADTSIQPTWGWIGLSVGVVGLAVGGVTAAMLASQRSSLDESCEDSRCPSDVSDDVSSYNQLRPISTIGFVVGGVGLATGIVLLATAPRFEAGSREGVTAWVGLGSAGMRGRF